MKGEKRNKLEKEKGVIVRFVIGHRYATIDTRVKK